MTLRAFSPNQVGLPASKVCWIFEIRKSAAEDGKESIFGNRKSPEGIFSIRRLSAILDVTSWTQPLGQRAIISTHSPLVVEEASFPRSPLVRDHEIFQPSLTDELRGVINTDLALQVEGPRMLFASFVLLVEGAGDREIGESLRRRRGAPR